MNGDLHNTTSKNTDTGKRSSAKKTRIQVALLDDTVVAFDVEPRAKGEELYKKVNTHLNLDEAEFFGLLFGDEEENNCWLDHLKPISKQVKEPPKITFKFRVMFYTPDPNSLQEYTRYLFTLQVRRDLLDGRLYCSEDTGALLASYIVQGELGDYDPMVHKDGYLAGFQFVPNQTPEIEQKIVDYHKSHRGESPAESDHNMLEIARQLDMYGVTLYPAQDSDGIQLHLAVFHLGVIVFQNKHKINNFSWASIRKLSFKKKKYLIKLHKGLGTNNNDEVVVFNMQTRNAAKTFWKVCVNHHVFFRQPSAATLKRQKSGIKRGSTYRYSGRTRKEITEDNAVAFRSTSESDEKNRSNPTTKIVTASSSSAPDSPFSNTSRQVSDQPSEEDDGSFSLASEAHATVPPLRQNETPDLEDDLYIPTSTHPVTVNGTHKVITIKHVETMDVQATPTHDRVVIDDCEKVNTVDLRLEESAPTFAMTVNGDLSGDTSLEYDDEEYTTISSNNGISDNSKPFTSGFPFNPSMGSSSTPTAAKEDVLNEGDDLSLDMTVKVTSTDREIEDEVESMFRMINSGSSWHYNISSVTAEDLKSDCGEERPESDAENQIHPSKVSESTEVDADEAKKKEFSVESDRTEADEETEAQLREKVKALYLQRCPSTQSVDSDSDASAITVDDEGSAFEDDLSLPRSACSSVSSIHKREFFLHELRKFKTTGVIYDIAKEILLTEKTYVKDLEVLTVSFRDVIEQDDVIPSRVIKLLYDNINPLYDFHCSLLAELEERLSQWENCSSVESTRDSVQKIGDIMHRNMRQIKRNTSYIKNHGDIIIELEKEAKRSEKFEKVYKEFEMSKKCYLSLNSFLLKPVQRLLYYRSILARLTKEYRENHPDAIDAEVAYEEVVNACEEIEHCVSTLENLYKTIEFQRDLIGIEDLVHPQRAFIREGCLYKICRKGPQPRMFFLLSDLLLYTSQGVTSANQFRARAQIPLRSLRVEDSGVELHGLYSFTIYGPGGKSFIVAANSPEEKLKWMDDIRNAVQKSLKKSVCKACQANKTEFILYVGQDNSHMCSSCQNDIEKLANMSPNERLKYWQSNYPPPPTIKRPFVEGDSDDEEAYSLQEQYSSLDRRHAHARTVSTRRVCWQRNASISMSEYTESMRNNLSGTLFRKYKNTSKWQKLWVVFTNFCFYFFKTCEDDSPLASLPLIGYTVSKPNDGEVHEEFSFKLQFKTHVYYFRAKTEYSFGRWMEVTSSAIKTGSRSRFGGRMNSVS